MALVIGLPTTYSSVLLIKATDLKDVFFFFVTKSFHSIMKSIKGIIIGQFMISNLIDSGKPIC